jgi:hypothetical protein
MRPVLVGLGNSQALVVQAHGRVPGDVLLQPVALASVLVLIANDHYLKGRAPGVLTGKLSDVAGLVLVPLLIVATAELVRRCLGRPWALRQSALVAAVVLTGVAFALVKALPGAADGYSTLLGVIGWPAHSLLALLRGHALPGLAPLTVRSDPTDLLAVPAVLLAWLTGRARLARG